MPEHTEFTIVQFTGFIRLYRLIYTKILMVSCKNFSCLSVRMIIQNKILQYVKKILFLTNTSKHCFQCYASFLLLRKALPLMKKFIFTPQCSYLCLRSIREHQKCIIVEKLRNCIKIICIIIRICVLHIYRILFQFDKKKWNPIHKSYNICTPAIQISMNLEFFYSKKLISFFIIWMFKINYHRSFFFYLSVLFFYFYRDSITNITIFFLINLH